MNEIDDNEMDAYIERIRFNVRCNIRILREYGNLSRKDLARRTGFKLSHLYALEQNGSGRFISLQGLAKIAHSLGTTVGRLTDSEFLEDDKREYVEEQLLGK